MAGLVDSTDAEVLLVRYTFRLRLGTQAEAALLSEWDRCRWVWNQLCECSKRRYAENGERPEGERLTFGYLSQNALLTGWRAEHDWLAEGSSVTQQQTVRTFAAARTKALKDRKAKLPHCRRRGLPRFKGKRHALPSMEYTRSGFRLDGARLVLAGGIECRPVYSRELPSDPSSVRVSRDPLGRWWASFVVKRPVEPLPSTGAGVGLDWGVRGNVAHATDPAFDLPHSEHGRKAAAGLARYQRQMARRKTPKGAPDSRGYQRAKRRAARAHYRVAGQRKDEARKWALRIVRSHDLIGVEDFKPRFLGKSRMARKAADARIAAAKTALADAAVKHGRTLMLIPAAYTTMTCNSCGVRAKHRLPLSERTFQCEACGHTQDRDRNAAGVVLNAAKARAGFHPAGVEDVRGLHHAVGAVQSEPGIPRL